MLTVLAERQNEFPGVIQQPVSIRAYPYGEMAAQVLGYVGQVSEPELKLRAFRGVKQGTVVGQEGLEYYYDRYLRGNAGGRSAWRSTPQGYPVPSSARADAAEAGHSLKVTLDLGLQKEGEKALLRGHRTRAAPAANRPTPGAFVALDPRNGQILAIGSYPSFDPNKFAKPLTQARIRSAEGRSSGGEQRRRR